MAKVVVDIDRGYKELGKRLRRFRDGPNVTIGVQATETSLTRAVGLTNVALAVVHEFGSKDGKIPQRSFLRGTADRERPLFERMLKIAARNITAGRNVRGELGRVGEKGVSEVKRTIDQSIGIEKNADTTIAAKGSTTPLIDTGILKNSITWKVHRT